MKILQLIDSLDAGGAERMAVNYANMLAEKFNYGALSCSRKEGILKKQLKDNVEYLFLNKKRTLDFGALFKLRKFVKSNAVEVIHAHGTSFFLAVLLKFTLPKIKIIWHDHYGNSEFLKDRNSIVLNYCSFFFDGIIAVNTKLESWARENLHCKKVLFLQNFVSFETNRSKTTQLTGIEGKRITCLANLREQKNHLLLLDVAQKINKDYPDWTFHLVGKDFKDNHSATVRRAIMDKGMSEIVFLYDSREDIQNILDQSDIAVLSSHSEGLPVALLEYGFFKKATVCTNVGQINAVIKNGVNGLLVESDNVEEFYNQLVSLLENKSLRMQLAERLHRTVVDNYSEQAILEKYLNFIKQ